MSQQLQCSTFTSETGLVLTTESQHEGSNSHHSGVQWWMKKGRGQATGWGQCSVFLSVLTLLTGRTEHSATNNPVLLLTTGSFWNKWRKKN